MSDHQRARRLDVRQHAKLKPKAALQNTQSQLLIIQKMQLIVSNV